MCYGLLSTSPFCLCPPALFLLFPFSWYSFAPSPWLGSIVEFVSTSATSANQRSVSRTCLKYALTHRCHHQENHHPHHPVTHSPLPLLKAASGRQWVEGHGVGDHSPVRSSEHPPRNDFIFNINCCNRVTMATTTLGITQDATMSRTKPLHNLVGRAVSVERGKGC